MLVMHVLTLYAFKTAARKRRRHISGKPDATCALSSCVSSLAFLLTGVLEGVGDDVPEDSGVGDGRTRGCARMS